MARLPPVAWLQAFEAAGRTLSFTRAGEELAVTQSAISQRIRMLEARLGQDLFIRHARSLTLTEAGRAWLPSVQDAFDRLAHGTAEVFGPEPDAPVTIRATPAIQQFWLAPRLQSFHRQQPETPLRVVTGVWADDFIGEDVDLEIRYGAGDWPHLVQQSLGTDALTPVCAPALAATLTAPSALTGHTLLHTAGFTVGWPDWLDAAGLSEMPARHLWCDTQSMTLRLAAQGCGIALAHRGLVGDPQILVAPFELACPARQQFVLTRPERRSLRPPAERFWNHLLATID
ncbi:LysR substrate-binding domain-containing protein [Salinisphaera sp. LB1]|uniref:LysR substrate-binding domain-containing protein n=1 Tax=Salinisphaera sp. LB1 TaxID=2183911 RepID=UPI000D707581|nr:LysR substrate-binding domain-containing protein [Salinisphaera sp. LB1]AWN15712.1 Transcriptional regulator, LysR family [Salinisphaera sp. LB1]